jgi:hypothetical protein
MLYLAVSSGAATGLSGLRVSAIGLSSKLWERGKIQMHTG